MDQRIFIEPERELLRLLLQLFNWCESQKHTQSELEFRSYANMKKNTRTETRLIESLSIT